MKRLELITNNSIYYDIIDAFKAADISNYYTKIENVHGIGSEGQKWGTHTWPEENFILIIYCSNVVAEKITQIIKDIKIKFKDEGTKLYSVDAINLC